jgi:hypothetical protein
MAVLVVVAVHVEVVIFCCCFILIDDHLFSLFPSLLKGRVSSAAAADPITRCFAATERFEKRVGAVVVIILWWVGGRRRT